MYNLKKTKINQNFPITIINAKEQKAFIGVDGKSEQETRILPEEYTQVEYITSDGNSYIDTNLQINGDFEIDLDFIKNQSSSGEQPIISIWTSQYNYWNLYLKTNDILEWYVSGHNIAKNIALTQGQKVHVNLKRMGNNFTFIQDNSTMTFSFSNDNNPTTLKILKRGDLNHNSYISVGVITINKNGILTQKLIPCYRNSDNAIGMYDIVNNNFYTNVGSGTFLKGNNVSIPSPNYPSEIHSVADDVNLFDKDTGIVNGLTYTSNGGTTSLASAFIQETYINVNPNTSYTLSTTNDYSTQDPGEYRLVICEYNASKTFIQRNLGSADVHNKYSIQTTSNTYYVRICASKVTINELKLQEGTVATPYSPYNQGTVTIKQRGKNLFDYDYAKEYSNTTVSSYRFVKIADVEINQRYVIGNLDTTDIENESGLYIYITNYPDYSSGVMNGNALCSNSNKLPSFKEIIVPTLSNSLYIGVYPSTINETQWTKILDKFKNAMLVKGQYTEQTLPPYEPYQTPHDYTIQTEPLRSLPNGVKDTIEEDGIHRRVGRRLLQASDIHSIATTGTVPYARIDKLTLEMVKGTFANNTALMRSYAITGNINYSNTSSGQFNTYYDKYFLAIFDDRFTDLATAKQLLEGEEIIFELEEEILEPFTEEQQEVINSMKTFEGTNIFDLQQDIDTSATIEYREKITEEIKNAVINNAEKAYIEVLDTGEIFDETNYLQEVKLNDERYVEGRGFIGSVIAKELTGKLINNNDDFYNLENKEIKYYDGPIMDDGSEKYFDYGTFIVQKPENDNVKDDTSFTAFDYMIKFNKKFEDRLDYSTGTVTVLELLEDICDQADVVLGTKNFRNSNFILENNQFVGGETCRDVLSNIAQIAFSWARINEDDELVLDFNPSNEIVETLNTDDYFDLKFNDLYGPINTIVLSNSVVTGENYTIHSPDFDPEIDEEIILEIQDNVFAYTEQKRYQLIQAGAALFGFQYVPITIKTCGRNYLNCLDKIRIKNVQNQNYDTYIFNNTLSYSGITLDEKKSPAMTNTEVKYEYTGDLSKGLKRTEIIVDKQEQKIEGIVSEIGDRTEKTTTITADIDGLNSQVQEIADVTETAESIFASVSLEKINSSEPVEIKIRPIINNISYLYPRDNLYPSDDLYMTDRIIRFIRTYEEDEETKTENIDYLLPDDLLYYDSQIYDEFYLNYNTKTCQITKKCKYNSDGTVGLLSEPVITDYEYPHILLNEGNYEVKILGYSSGYILARLMLINEYTSQFTTRVEMNSSIKQTADEINLEVSKKVGDDEIISKINQSAEQIQISADKIDIDGKAVHFKTEIDETVGPYTFEDVDDVVDIVVGRKVPTQEELDKYDVDGDGRVSAIDWLFLIKAINNNNGYITTNGTFEINPYSSKKSIAIWNNQKKEYSVSLSPLSSYLNKISTQEIRIDVDNAKQLFTYYSGTSFELNNEVGSISGYLNHSKDGSEGPMLSLYTRYFPYGQGQAIIDMECLDNGVSSIYLTGFSSHTSTEITNEGITTPTVIQTSLKESKKNFEKLKNGLDIVNATDIYKYNLKGQKDNEKKHIGFVIGENYKYSQEITSDNNDGVDIYSMVSVAYKAIQEQQEIIKDLQKQINEMKGDK